MTDPTLEIADSEGDASPDTAKSLGMVSAGLLLEIPGGTVSVARLIGVRDGTALLMELIDDNVASFAFLEPDLESLFRSVRLRTVA